jgi:pantetheine-phosphate adenylyltransferase
LKICVYPGSFDPVTNGHLDIIERVSKICDKLIVAVLVNSSKNSSFSLDERVNLLRCALKGKEGIEVESFSGLLINFMKEKNATAIIKGLRAVSDFEYELQIALVNKNLDPEIETLFMMSSVNYSFLSSSIVKELARNGGKINDLVPECIVSEIYKKLDV